MSKNMFARLASSAFINRDIVSVKRDDLVGILKAFNRERDRRKNHQKHQRERDIAVNALRQIISMKSSQYCELEAWELQDFARNTLKQIERTSK